MNDKLEYASMLEIPVNTCNITYKPAKKKLFSRKKNVNPDKIKENLLKKVNSDEGQSDLPEQAATLSDNATEEPTGAAEIAAEKIAEQDALSEDENSSLPAVENYEPTVTFGKVKKNKNKGRFGISFVALELVVIGVLIATIFVTNALYTDSGVNAFIRSVFGREAVSVDNRTYVDFAPVIATDGKPYAVSDGVVTFAAEGSVYPPCDGTVDKLVQTVNGKYEMTIKHNRNFSSLITGIDYAYFNEGDKVYGTLPVGYSENGGSQMCFKGADGNTISEYTVVNDSVVWQV